MENERQQKKKIGRGFHWTSDEEKKFRLGLEMYGSNWKKVAEIVVTKSASAI